MVDLTTRVRLKAEWEKQLAIFMAFPHQNSDWTKHIHKARACFLDIIEHIVCFESVILCIDTQDDEGFEIVKKHFSKALDSTDSRDSVNADFMKTQDDEYIKNLFNQSVPYTLIQNPKSKYLANFGGNSAFSLHIVRVPTNDTWARDFGAISVELESPQNLAQNPSQNMAQNRFNCLILHLMVGGLNTPHFMTMPSQGLCLDQSLQGKWIWCLRVGALIAMGQGCF